MYAISSVNDEKYRTLSYALEQAFPDSYNKFSNIDQSKLAKIVSFMQNNPTASVDALQDEIKTHGEFQDTDLTLTIKKQFKDLIVNKKIRLRESDDWLEIEVGSNVLFDSGSSFLNDEAEKLIKELAAVLKNTKETITIEGFTDNVPIHNAIYPSNWELSADRAAAVVTAFTAAGIESRRLAITGYGENFPITDNTTVKGQKKNRRIIIVVEKNNKRKKYLEAFNNEEN
jgi:chemotaxis protein MotB